MKKLIIIIILFLISCIQQKPQSTVDIENGKSTQLLETDQKKITEFAFITGKNVRIRKQPSVDSEVIRTGYKNEYVALMNKVKSDIVNDEQGDWQLVKLQDGLEGWVFGSYLQIIQDELYIWFIQNMGFIGNDYAITSGVEKGKVLDNEIISLVIKENLQIKDVDGNDEYDLEIFLKKNKNDYSFITFKNLKHDYSVFYNSKYLVYVSNYEIVVYDPNRHDELSEYRTQHYAVDTDYVDFEEIRNKFSITTLLSNYVWSNDVSGIVVTFGNQDKVLFQIDENGKIIEKKIE